jgi:hypothetical protein
MISACVRACVCVCSCTFSCHTACSYKNPAVMVEILLNQRPAYPLPRKGLNRVQGFVARTTFCSGHDRAVILPTAGPVQAIAGHPSEGWHFARGVFALHSGCHASVASGMSVVHYPHRTPPPACPPASDRKHKHDHDHRPAKLLENAKDARYRDPTLRTVPPCACQRSVFRSPPTVANKN